MALTGSRSRGKRVPVALIVDSPWLPGFRGISMLDYFLLPDEWMSANLYLEERFPEVLFLPGHWVEYGMAAEPSAFGCRIKWWKNSPPAVIPSLRHLSEAAGLQVPNPEEDGLMPLILRIYQKVEKGLQNRAVPLRWLRPGASGHRRPCAGAYGIPARPEGFSERDETVHRGPNPDHHSLAPGPGEPPLGGGRDYGSG